VGLKHGHPAEAGLTMPPGRGAGAVDERSRSLHVQLLVGLIGMTPKAPPRKSETYVNGDCCKSHFYIDAKRPPKGPSNFQKRSKTIKNFQKR
jgi:hypothetical protein